jgi:hypothetical protein
MFLLLSCDADWILGEIFAAAALKPLRVGGSVRADSGDWWLRSLADAF